MRAADVVLLAAESLARHRLRTGLCLLAIAIGATAVLLLTALGDAAKRYVVDQFAALGTNMVGVAPGRVETSGWGPVLGGTRDLSLEDAEDIRRRAPAVIDVLPFSLGAGSAEYEDRHRDVYIMGVTSSYARVRGLAMTSGRFLPPGDSRRGEPVVVLGSKLRHELFGGENPLGRSVRLAGARFRVIGVASPKGMSLGVDLDEVALVPVAAGLRLFNQSGLHRMLVQARDEASVPAALAQTRAILTERHRGEDFTLATQDAMLESFRSVIQALTLALAAIGAISLAVAGIGIMNVMLVSVSERVGEIGLLKALGGRARQIQTLFVTEALILSGVGALCGLALGAVALRVASRVRPDLSLAPSPLWAGAVLAVSLAAGSLFGMIPARRAARLPAAGSLRGRR